MEKKLFFFCLSFLFSVWLNQMGPVITIYSDRFVCSIPKINTYYWRLPRASAVVAVAIAIIIVYGMYFVMAMNTTGTQLRGELIVPRPVPTICG